MFCQNFYPFVFLCVLELFSVNAMLCILRDAKTSSLFPHRWLIDAVIERYATRASSLAEGVTFSSLRDGWTHQYSANLRIGGVW